MNKEIIAKNIKKARENRGLSQKELAKLMGWKSHATICAIENADQNVKTWELLKLAEILKVSPESLYSETSIFDVARKPVVLWRKLSMDAQKALQEEHNIIQHVEDYRFIEKLINNMAFPSKPLPKQKYDIHKENLNKWANFLAERISKDFQLGDYPGESLAKCLEEDYGILIMSRNLESGSAACYREDDVSVIVLNRNEPLWRQIFSLAHELFHLITWDDELIQNIKNNEKLFKQNEVNADAFAAALLMPYHMIKLDIRERQLSYSFIVALARKYHVSTEAMLWRLKYLKIISYETVQQVLMDSDFKRIDKLAKKEAFKSSLLLENRFIRLAYLAFEKGKLSRSRLAKMLCIKLRDVTEYLSEKGLYLTNDKEIQMYSD